MWWKSRTWRVGVGVEGWMERPFYVIYGQRSNYSTVKIISKQLERKIRFLNYGKSSIIYISYVTHTIWMLIRSQNCQKYDSYKNFGAIVTNLAFYLWNTALAMCCSPHPHPSEILYIIKIVWTLFPHFEGTFFTPFLHTFQTLFFILFKHSFAHCVVGFFTLLHAFLYRISYSFET